MRLVSWLVGFGGGGGGVLALKLEDGGWKESCGYGGRGGG